MVSIDAVQTSTTLSSSSSASSCRSEARGAQSELLCLAGHGSRHATPRRVAVSRVLASPLTRCLPTTTEKPLCSGETVSQIDLYLNLRGERHTTSSVTAQPTQCGGPPRPRIQYREGVAALLQVQTDLTARRAPDHHSPAMHQLDSSLLRGAKNPSARA